MLTALLQHASLASQAAPPPPADTIAQRMQACTACHGQEGRATSSGYFPRIAGKPAGYLYNQLANFRDGRRRNAAMSYLLDPLSDEYLREIAAYFASLDVPYPPVAVPAETRTALERGAALVARGDAQRRIPACTQCHGDKMTGVRPATPGLLGLPRDYLVAQLGAWKTGQRKSHAPDCMAEVAARLTAQDVGDVAAWLASQAPPADAKPAAAHGSNALPIACGGGGPK